MFEPTPVRFLAPLALVLAVIAVVVVIGSASPAPKTASKPTTTAQARPTKKTALVRSGDTMTSISDRTGVSVAVLLRLNPDVDPNALPVGKPLKLR
jgi:LysM repeat protein